jgi:hypothetical protein
MQDKAYDPPEACARELREQREEGNQHKSSIEGECKCSSSDLAILWKTSQQMGVKRL